VATGELLVPPPPETTLPPKPPATTVAPTTTKPPPTAAPTTTKPPPTTTKPAPPATTPPDTAPPDTAPPGQPPAGPSLYEALSRDARFSTLMELARIAGYGRDLGQTGPFTVFAPTNDAFATMEPDELKRLQTDPEAADALLRDLVVEGDLTGSQLAPGPLRTIGGGTIVIAESGGGTTAGGAPVTADAIEASNGIVHALGAVPTPG
jgi:hypothetical protein